MKVKPTKTGVLFGAAALTLLAGYGAYEYFDPFYDEDDFLSEMSAEEVERLERKVIRNANQTQLEVAEYIRSRGEITSKFMQAGQQDITITAQAYVSEVKREGAESIWDDSVDVCFTPGRFIEGTLGHGDYQYTGYRGDFKTIGVVGAESKCYKYSDDRSAFFDSLAGYFTEVNGTQAVNQHYVVNVSAYVDVYADNTFAVYFSDSQGGGFACEGDTDSDVRFVNFEGTVWEADFQREVIKGLNNGDVPIRYENAEIENCARVSIGEDNRHAERFTYLKQSELLP